LTPYLFHVVKEEKIKLKRGAKAPLLYFVVERRNERKRYF
jgi:hypothetical protein